MFILDSKNNLHLQERESYYKQQIEENEKKLQNAFQEIEAAKSDLANLQEDKESNEKLLNSIMVSSQQEFEQQMESLNNEKNKLQEHSSYSFHPIFTPPYIYF